VLCHAPLSPGSPIRLSRPEQSGSHQRLRWRAGLSRLRARGRRRGHAHALDGACLRLSRSVRALRLSRNTLAARAFVAWHGRMSGSQGPWLSPCLTARHARVKPEESSEWNVASRPPAAAPGVRVLVRRRSTLALGEPEANASLEATGWRTALQIWLQRERRLVTLSGFCSRASQTSRLEPRKIP
jgi:hypothetical protein